MPNAPVSNPPTTAAKVPAAGKTDAVDSDAVKKGDDVIPTPAKVSPLVLVLGALSAFLFIIVVVFWLKVNAQNTAILENKNRVDQFGAATAQMQAQL